MARKKNTAAVTDTTDTATVAEGVDDQVEAEDPEALAGGRRQQSLPGEGFAQKDIPRLTSAAEKCRAARDARMELQRKEKAAKEERNGILRELLASGELQMAPPEVAEDLEERPLYRYQDADGRWHKIVWVEGFKDQLDDEQDGDE